MSTHDDALTLVEQMAEGWSKWLEINKAKRFKPGGPLSLGAIEMLVQVEHRRSSWSELIRRADTGNRDAKSAIYYEAWTLIKRGMALPAPLSTYFENILLERLATLNARQGGAGRYPLRDAFIIQADHQLQTLGVKQAQKRHSVIARVLQDRGYRMRARGVEAVCEKMRPRRRRQPR